MKTPVVLAFCVASSFSTAAVGHAQPVPPLLPPSELPVPAPFVVPQPPAPPLAARVVAGDDAPELLLSGPVSHGAYGGPTAAYTRLRGEDALLVGGRGGWLINHRLVLGGGGAGVTNRLSVPAGATSADADHQLSFGYGGFWMEYVVAPSRLVHGSVGTLIGAGGLTYHRFRGAAGVNEDESTDAIFVLEPTATAEVNVTQFMRLCVFVSYRAVGGVQLTGLDVADVRGAAGGAMLKFGVF